MFQKNVFGRDISNDIFHQARILDEQLFLRTQVNNYFSSKKTAHLIKSLVFSEFLIDNGK